MLFISHRGNTFGPEPKRENTLEHIQHAFDFGFDVEIDVWYVDGVLRLGHDVPGETLPMEYIHNQKLWFHCKNVRALLFLQHQEKVKYFWHEKDQYTITSNKKIWTYPGKQLVPSAVAVLPEVKLQGSVFELFSCHAICTDFPIHYQALYKSHQVYANV